MYFYSVQVFLVIIYVVFFLWLFFRLRMAERMGIPFVVLAGLYALNVCCSLLNLAFHLQDYAESDAAFYFEQARATLRELPQNPGAILYDIFFNWGDWHGRLNFLNPANTPYWSNLGSLFNGKFMLLATALSGGYIAVTTVFYTAAFFMGQTLLYRALCSLQPAKPWVLMVAVFLLPSVLFWCQGIHKDGWMMMAFGVLLYGMVAWQFAPKRTSIFIIIAALLFSLLVRYFYIMLLVPALLFWYGSLRTQQPARVFLIGYGILFFCLVAFSTWVPALNPMPLLLIKQAAFVALQGDTSFELPLLNENVWSLMVAMPQALWHVFITPPVNANSIWAQGMVCAESVVVLLLWIGLIVKIPRSQKQQAIYWFMMAYALTAYLLIGVTIPNTGALARYRSEYMLMITAVLVSISQHPWLLRLEQGLSKFISPLANRI